jgi:hypothetical protein
VQNRGTLVLEQPLQHADRGVEGRTCALWRFAVPPSVVELLAGETTSEALGGAPEVCAEREDAAVDAGFDFSFEEGLEWLVTELLVPLEACFEASYGRLDGGIVGVDAGRAQVEQSEEGG